MDPMYGDESWPSFDERFVVSSCEACGLGADDWGKDFLDGCPDCGARGDDDVHEFFLNEHRKRWQFGGAELTCGDVVEV